jgi:ribosome biogenesis SPOUT family RNA methylase Rps3
VAYKQNKSNAVVLVNGQLLCTEGIVTLQRKDVASNEKKIRR